MPKAKNAMALPIEAGVMPLEIAVNKYLDGYINTIMWPPSIYVATAFAETVTDSSGISCVLSEFMRPPDTLVVFPNGDVLLLSEWEADQVLSLMWKEACSVVSSVLSNAQGQSFFANLTYLREAAGSQNPSAEIKMRVPPAPLLTNLAVSCRTRLGVAGRGSPAAGVSDITLAGLQLFAGETMFATEERRCCVTQLVTPTLNARKAALQLVRFRGRQNFISRSNLENICNVDIGEA